MTAIDPRHPLAGALQARLGAARPPARAAAARAAAGAPPAADAQSAAAALAPRLAAIAATDPDRPRQAVRALLEVELARAFGVALLNDPGFPQMLDAVQEQLQADAEGAAAVQALGSLLLAASAG